MSSSKLTLGDIVELIRGTTYKGKLLGQPGPYLLGLASIQKDGGFRDDNLKTYGGETADKLLLYPGDIFVSLKDVTQSANLLGAVARVPESISVGRLTQDTLKLVFKRRSVPSEFIYWILRTPQYRAYCKAHATGTTTLGLSRDDFLSFPVPEYDGATSFLVELLESIEKKIRLNNQTARTLEELAQRLFKSWFVDFDPVRAKMAGRQPAHMPPETAALFPDRLVDSPLGRIPCGWAVTEVENVCKKIINGGTPKRKEAGYWHPPMHSWFKTGELHDTWLVDSSEKISDEGLKNSAAKLSPRGTVLIAIYAAPTVGRLGVLANPGAFNQACTALIPRNDISPWFIFWTMYFLRSELNNISTGAAQQNISKKIVAQQKIIHPDFKIHQVFNELIDPLHERVLALARENLLLVQLRDRLLPKLISGEIRVPAEAAQTEDML